ncbi:GL22020 [Drosophila persimilis]|uniref:GL22020 n=1 Tax=Drosophila persimilis TaxID=7234 RepID=B4GEG8_DROPE|nr:enhancer of split M2 protein [Drosophila persimilis]EDW34003.1 GL22020 [Drosophila persimilis]
MYLDTKNLTASSTNTNTNSSSSSIHTSASMTATAATPLGVPKTVRRMRKVWQPLRRLLTVGGKGRPAPLTLAHPNNVDLNNTQQQQQQQQQQIELILEDESKSTPEESIYKYGAELRQLPVEDEVSLTQPPNTPTLISSVYVEKASAQSCGACPHGRNCQHTHHNSNSNRNTTTTTATSSATAAQLPSNLWDLQLPLQYISTDNGTFFWANTQERVDDDLLHALLCQSFSQLPGTLC